MTVGRNDARAVPGGGLLHPVALFAITLLVINDHLWKHTHPGLVTGKLSDIAGMIFFPLFLQGLVECGQFLMSAEWRPSRAVLLVCAVATALVLVAVKTSPEGAHAYRVIWGVVRWPLSLASDLTHARPLHGPSRVSLTQDAGDALAAPFVALAVLAGWRRASPAETIPFVRKERESLHAQV